jgi:NAD(P)-dependent dehydrogenase (short-subunit alcohol dehydrogenase family)
MTDGPAGRGTGTQSLISLEPGPPWPAQRQDHPGLESRMDPPPKFRGEHYKAADKLVDKVALITGGDSGIGRAVAVLYAREGADVAIVYLPEEQSDAEEVKRVVEEYGRQCLLLPGDLTERSFCREIVEETVREFGRLDIVVSNAAHLNSKTDLDQLTDEDWDRTFKTNIYAYYYLVKAALPHLSEGSCILATGSEEGLKGSNVMVDYAATKAAMLDFTKSLAPHLARQGVRANIVVPGPTWTPLNIADQGLPMEQIVEMGTSTDWERPAQPEEVAPAFVYLASDADSSYVTGEAIAVTGGLKTTN